MKSRFETAAIFLALIGIALLVGGLSVQSRARYYHAAETTATNLAEILREDIESTFRHAEGDLLVFADVLKPADLLQAITPQRRAEIQSLMALHLRQFPEISNYRVFTADGETLLGAGTAPAKFNVSDRMWFRSLKDEPDRNLAVSEVVIGKGVQVPALIIAVPIRAADGRFLGAVNAVLELSRMQRLIDAPDIGAKAVIAIRRSDTAQLIVRRPAIAREVNAPVRTPLWDRIHAGENSGVMELASVVDDEVRVHAFTRLHAYPLVAIVGVARGDFLRPWLIQSAVAGVSTLAFALLLGWLFLRQQRTQRSLEASEVEAKRSAGRYESLLAAAGEGICGVDPAGTITFINPTAQQMLGYAKEQLVGANFHVLMHHHDDAGTDNKSFDCGLARVLGASAETGGANVLQVDNEFFRRQDGTRFAVEYSVARIDGDGAPDGAVITFRDVSERKAAEMALRSSETRFATVFQASPFGIVISKRETGEIVDANDSFLQIFGYRRDEAIGRTSIDLHMFADPEERGRMAAIMARDGCLKHYEGAMVRKNGQRGVFLASISQIEIGGQPYFLSLLSDYTERRAAEDRLRQAATVFESTLDGIVVTDAKGCITAVNSAFCGITGFAQAEALGQRTSISKSERHDASFYGDLWRSLTQTGSWRGEIWNRRKNGEIYPVRMTINAVKDQYGKVLNYVGVFSDITSIKQYEERLEFLANHDPLTGLPNRLLLGDRISHGIARAQRLDEQLAVLFIDLDSFKRINDSLGHPAGDRLLQAVAARLTACVRGKDTVARLGGDEFVVVQENVGEMSEVVSLAEKILQALAAPMLIDNHTVYVGASIGISTYPNDGGDSVALLKNADAAMYKAKDSGRNTFWFCDAELTQRARDHLNLESALRHALQEQEFVLHYQPQIEVATGAIIGVEALVRWNRPASGLVPPGEFIPFAEQTGLIVPMGEWILLAACRQLRAWLDEGIAPMTMAVNISPRQFASRDMLQQIQSALAASRIPPQLLELEITEGAIMERGENAVEALNALKALGVRLSIDDFGTGYSSLAYLRRFPIDALKIDQSFMRDIPHDPGAVEIAKTIIAMGQNLHMTVLAEGVETEAQIDFLKGQGCHLSQGYWHSRPVAAAAIVALLAVNRSGCTIPG